MKYNKGKVPFFSLYASEAETRDQLMITLVLLRRVAATKSIYAVINRQ